MWEANYEKENIVNFGGVVVSAVIHELGGYWLCTVRDKDRSCGRLAGTGSQAPIALAHKRGLVLRLEQIGNKIGGHPVKVFYEDCKEEVAPTVEKVRKLIEGDRVHISLAPFTARALRL